MGIILFIPIGMYLGIYKVPEIIERYCPQIIQEIRDKPHSLIVNMTPQIFIWLIIFIPFIIIGANIGNFVSYKIKKSRNFSDIQKVKLLELIKMNCNCLCFFRLRSFLGCLVGILFVMPFGFASALLFGGNIGGGCLAMFIGKVMEDIEFLKKLFPISIINYYIPVYIGLLIGFSYTFLIILIIFLIIGANAGNLIGYGILNIVNTIKSIFLMK